MDQWTSGIFDPCHDSGTLRFALIGVCTTPLPVTRREDGRFWSAFSPLSGISALIGVCTTTSDPPGGQGILVRVLPPVSNLSIDWRVYHTTTSDPPGGRGILVRVLPPVWNLSIDWRVYHYQ